APTGGAVGDLGGRSLRDRTGTGEELRPAERSATLRANWCRGRTPTGGAVGDHGGRSLRDRTERGGRTPTGGAVGDTASQLGPGKSPDRRSGRRPWWSIAPRSNRDRGKSTDRRSGRRHCEQTGAGEGLRPTERSGTLRSNRD